MECYTIPLKKKVKGLANLYGATLGQQHRKELYEELSRSPDLAHGPGALVVVDFSGIASVTASYLKAMVFSLIRAGVHFVDPQFQSELPPLNIYSVVAGASSEIDEELHEVATSNGLLCLHAIKMHEDVIQTARLLGSPDASIVDTLATLTKENPATATQLLELNPSTKITVNGWNNRLADLHRLRLATRERSGRQWTYAPLARRVFHG